jgi:phenylalanine-4-hydroxylase
MDRTIDAYTSNRGASALRGDYSRKRADYSVDQDWTAYRDSEHALWRRLYARQMALVPRYACTEFLQTLASLDAGDAIPRFDAVSERLINATGWRLVAVPGLIPDFTFFTHLANRRFPVTVWLRKPEEFDYIVEPDVFHDFYGHVPLLFDRRFADYLQAYGEGGLKAERLDALKFLARLYWYTVEFGLIRTASGPRIYGAGILSSGGEVVHAIESRESRRVMFDLERVLRTEYRIDRFQETYFVIESFDRLIADTAPDFTPLYARIRDLPSHASDARVAGDVELSRA